MSLVYNRSVDDEDLEQYDRSLSKEAQRVVQEINFGVDFVEVSAQLENNEAIAYLNIRTLEKEYWCIELTASGYLVVANSFDFIDQELKEKNLERLNKFETIEALMNSISPLFIEKFNSSVADRLLKFEHAQ
jgi:hypothetical protein